MRVNLYRKAGRGFFSSYAPASLLRRDALFLQRYRRAGAWYVLASTGVLAAAVVVASVLTWWPNEAYKPITHPLERVIERIVPGGELLRQAEAIERVLPEGVARQVQGRVASVLKADEGTLRTTLMAVSEGVGAVRGDDSAGAGGGEGSGPPETATIAGGAEEPAAWTASEPVPPPESSAPSPPAPPANEPPPPPAPAAGEEEPPPPATDEPASSPPPISSEPPPAAEPPSDSEPPTDGPPPSGPPAVTEPPSTPPSGPTSTEPPTTIEPPLISEPPAPPGKG